MSELKELREQIDAIDRQMLALFEERMQVARQVACYKSAHGMEIFVPEREKAVLQDRVSQLKDPAFSQAAEEFFRHLMELSRGEQQKLLAERGGDR